MQLKLNKADIILTIIMSILSLALVFFVYTKSNNNSHKVAEVYYKNNLVHTFDLNDKEKQTFKIQATNGLVTIESENGKVRVADETSNRHICSIQGWSDSVTTPIVCLPNELYIQVKSDNDNSDIDGVIS